MELYITELSKYFIALLMAFYALECFWVFRFSDEEKRNGTYIRQTILMFLIHFSCFMVIVFETEDIRYLIFYALQQVFLFGTITLFRSFYPKINRLIVNNMCMLLTIGFVILTRISLTKAIKQFLIVAFSVAVCLFIPFLVRRLTFLKKLTYVYAAVGIFSLGIVYIMGQVTNGSKLSYTIGGITFQPSEIIKLVFVFFVASSLAQSHDFVAVLTSALFAAIHIIILVLSKDLGSALIFFVVYVLMVFVITRNIFYLLAGALGGCAAALISYRFFTHVQVRVQAWQDPWTYIDSSGYQIGQSLFAIGSGGLFGMGLFKGSPNNIPFVEADFVFSAVAEELGLVFAMCMILVCLSCFIMFMNISIKLDNPFYRLIAFGYGVTYIFQIFLTIGGGTKFIPLTGVTLPFVSYGGTSVLTTLVMFSIIEGLYMVRQDEMKQKKKLKKRVYVEDTQEIDAELDEMQLEDDDDI